VSKTPQLRKPVEPPEDYGDPIREFSELERMFMGSTKTMAHLVEFTLNILRDQEILIAGAFALYKHAEPRATRDFDLVVSPTSMDAVESVIQKNGFKLIERYEYQNPKRFLHNYQWNERKLDLIYFENKKFSDFLFATSEPMKVFGSSLAKVVSAEGLVLMKLISARGGKKPGTENIGRDFTDIQAVVEKTPIDWSLVKSWAADLEIMYKFGDLIQYLGIET